MNVIFHQKWSESHVTGTWLWSSPVTLAALLLVDAKTTTTHNQSWFNTPQDKYLYITGMILVRKWKNWKSIKIAETIYFQLLHFWPVQIIPTFWIFFRGKSLKIIFPEIINGFVADWKALYHDYCYFCYRQDKILKTFKLTFSASLKV